MVGPGTSPRGDDDPRKIGAFFLEVRSWARPTSDGTAWVVIASRSLATHGRPRWTRSSDGGPTACLFDLADDSRPHAHLPPRCLADRLVSQVVGRAPVDQGLRPEYAVRVAAAHDDVEVTSLGDRTSRVGSGRRPKRQIDDPPPPASRKRASSARIARLIAGRLPVIPTALDVPQRDRVCSCGRVSRGAVGLDRAWTVWTWAMGRDATPSGRPRGTVGTSPARADRRWPGRRSGFAGRYASPPPCAGASGRQRGEQRAGDGFDRARLAAAADDALAQQHLAGTGQALRRPANSRGHRARGRPRPTPGRA